MVSNTDLTGFDYTGTCTSITSYDETYYSDVELQTSWVNDRIAFEREQKQIRLGWTIQTKPLKKSQVIQQIQITIRNKLYNKRLIRQANVIET